MYLVRMSTLNILLRVSQYNDIRGRNISMDRYFTSVTLAEWASSKDITIVGTMRLDRIGSVAKLVFFRRLWSFKRLFVIFGLFLVFFFQIWSFFSKFAKQKKIVLLNYYVLLNDKRESRELTP